MTLTRHSLTPELLLAYWRTTNLEAWPPGAPVAEKSGKLIAEAAPAQNLAPYGAYQPLLLPAPYYAAYNLPLAYVVQPTIASATIAGATTTTTTTSTTTTGRPESLAEDSSSELEKPEKLQVLPAEKTRTTGDLKSDVGLRSAVSKINPEYVIEEIVPVPGKLVISTSGSPRSAKQQLKKATGPQKLKLRKQAGGRVPLKVEATGRTSTNSGNFPQIPFGNYFLPYRPEQAQAIQGRKQAALILEPHSKAVVGNGGTAISTPISKAYLKKGVPTNVYFNPESVAIAGVGGKAHATADLELDLFTHRSRSAPLVFEEHPYYGGLRGQLLQLRPQRDGSVGSFILQRQQPQVRAVPRDSDDTVTISAASISAVADGSDSSSGSSISASASDFNRIQLAAARLVAIQELAKRKGSFSEEDNKIYASSLLELGQAAQSLALLQQTGQIKDFSVLLQPEMFGIPQKQPANFGLEATNNPDQKIDEQKLDEVTEQQFSPDEQFLPPNSEDPYEDVNDSVSVMAPKKDAAVAEAKPVGLSIAGEGGVASSKPNAVALSGRNGLAVASPKATAIAGVSPEEAAAFSISLPTRNQLVIKSPNLASEKSSDDYDYNDIPLTVARFPLTRETPQQMVPVRISGGDSLVKRWRTAIAEDYAARQALTKVAMPHPTPFIRMAPKRRLHSE